MRDTVFLRGLEAVGILGVQPAERGTPRTVRIDVDLACDAGAAARDDDLARAVDYRAVADAVRAHVGAHAYRLVETLAERLAEHLQREFGAPWVRVRVGKPGAVDACGEVGVEVVRGQRPSGS
jgi:dihydroneopterin aldolase